MKASPADQRILLEVADLDRRIAGADASRRNAPQAARIHELQALRQAQTHELTVRAGARDDIRLEISRIETDVEVARTRRERDRERLAQATDPKQATAYEREIEALGARLDKLEDAELEAMERLEGAEAAVAEQEGVIAQTNAEGAELTAAAKTLVADANAAFEAHSRDRAAVAPTVPAALLAQYDRLAQRGIGAAMFRRGMCEGCNIVLPASDLADVQKAADDDVVFCPECGTILVRTEESGL